MTDFTIFSRITIANLPTRSFTMSNDRAPKVARRDNGHGDAAATASADDGWTPQSWRELPILQQPSYKDKELLKKSMEKLSSLPPLVQPDEIDDLRKELAEVGAGKRFILQGGDCAERFQDCNAERLQNKLKIILQMSVVLVWGARIPLTRIGRIAGQYMKPRSKPTEKHGDGEIMAYKGDAINGHDIAERDHDPDRLVQGYFHSAATLNYVRSLLVSAFADLHKPSTWDLTFVKDEKSKAKYDLVVKEITHALEFMASCGMAEDDQMSRVQLYTSHEGLVLDFEEAMTRKVGDKYYNLGAHFIWIGDRTRQIDGAHIEYFRGIENPVGCKCGPTTIPSELIALIQKLNPTNRPGKIVLISRFGAGNVTEKLTEIIQAVEAAGLNVVWECDPMHGNTFSTSAGVKTRDFKAILTELMESFAVHQSCGTWLGGVHFELTGENVTECVGGSCDMTAEDLTENYESFCDPRLNWQQSIEMAFRLVDVLKQRKAEN